MNNLVEQLDASVDEHPQREFDFNPAIMRTDYTKWKNPSTGERVYFGTFLVHGRPVKATRRNFKRARAAELYAQVVFSRYRKLRRAAEALEAGG